MTWWQFILAWFAVSAVVSPLIGWWLHRRRAYPQLHYYWAEKWQRETGEYPVDKMRRISESIEKAYRDAGKDNR